MNAAAHFPAVIAAISGALAGAVINRRVQRLQHRFKENGAISREHAVTLQELGVARTWVFDRLVRGEVLVVVPDGRYYLDEQAASLRRRQKQVVGMIVVSIVLLALLIICFIA